MSVPCILPLLRFVFSIFGMMSRYYVFETKIRLNGL